MKRIIAAVGFIGIFISCNSSEKTETPTTENSETETKTEEVITEEVTTEEVTTEEVSKNLKPIDTDEALIATALMSAPEASRANCKVIGYNMAGEFVTLKEGDNEFIILADNPTQKGFSAACYHKDLEPFMARGRELRAEGKGDDVFEIRKAEMKSGKLKITPGLTLNIYYGEETMYDPETSKVGGAKLRYVVYMPYATSESTGLPEMPVATNHPWIMHPGSHRAHIMISPLPETKE